MRSYLYADRVEIDKANITQAIRADRLSSLKRGREIYVLVEEADKIFRYSPPKPAQRIAGNVAKKTAREKACTGKRPTEKQNPIQTPADTAPDENDDAFELDRKIAFQRARKLKLENDLKEGTQIEKQPAEELYFKIARAVRDAAEALPPNVADLCVGKSRHEIENILLKEVKSVLTNLNSFILKTYA